ncbi:YtpR family tRNA-binding protein [Vaginisenegalia massiliensis]|uniref:YtpR family tRNA-binding protein n=1 Tax=Vaginisenegalia massiliensis TaxID=2058294 RepID=UPI000F51CD8A|nr:DUF4479 and tRNA-binding domain-containing protein [Vaginisenegalia massiliensis]
MWLAFYNPNGVGDVLMLTCANGQDLVLQTKTSENVTQIFNAETGELVAINIFDVSNMMTIDQVGPVTLTSEQVKQVNEHLIKLNLDVQVTVDPSPKLVVGHVLECQDHPDSDHLHVTKVQVAADQVLPIVCGAANIAQGQKVLVAKPGAVMPNGLIIWPGQLRGEESHGMICSTRELELTAIENQPGIWVLPDHFEVGTPLEDVVARFA